MSIEIPARLQETLADRYALERLIARGGMASVYLGRDLKHDRSVAVKVLRPELGALLGAERFLREIKLVARLQHPHILPLYDSGEADGTLYYVMPFVPGDSLRDRLRREQRLPLRDALWIAREVADALNYAHANEIVHRDIKPENILLLGAHAMVADFGIARAVHAAGGERWETLTDSGVAVGTPAYMSPEQTAGEHDLDGRSDIFSLGCVVYEMLAGVPPFTGPDGEVMIAKRFTDPAPVLRAVREEVPESVDLAVQRSLAREPEERFANALEFTEAIWDATHATGRVRRGAGRSGQRAARAPTTAWTTGITGYRARWVAGGIAAAGAAAIAAFWLTRPPDSPRTTPQSAALPPAATADSARPAAVPESAASKPEPELPAAQPESQPAPKTRTPPQRVRPEPPVRVPAVVAPRADSMLASLRIAARDARSRALSDGASQFDLFRGDSLERVAEASAGAGRIGDAIAQLMGASAAWADGARSAKTRATQAAKARESAAVATPPVVTARAPADSGAARAGAPAPTAAPPKAAAPAAAAPSAAEERAAIGTVIANYGRAIEAQSIPAIRQLYPAITATQQRDWQQFFNAVENIKVSLTITQLDVTGPAADARVTGTYMYENTSTRRLEEQPVSFRASLQRDAAGWRITGIR